MRPPSNKAMAVLALLREEGEMSCMQVSDAIRERTPCGACNGTGDGSHHRWGCERCYGRGRVRFHYSDAYSALKQLQAHRLVTRRYLKDEWGDVTSKLVWAAADVPAGDDPVEALYNAPAAER